MTIAYSNWEPVIGLEVHAELLTRSKMFCACGIVDVITAPPNSSVCPVCLGMPGVLPVVNQKAVELGMLAALALECKVLPVSIFARKNYFYPDLPKGYQISQYESPLAVDGLLQINTNGVEKTIRIRRVHLEEDTGKLTHIKNEKSTCSLVDLNRAGVPLLEIVTEPDMGSVDEARAYAETLHGLLRYLGVSSCDMEKGAIRFEANVSVRKKGSMELNTRTEIKNLNSFRSLERAVAYEIQRQIECYEQGELVVQETVGWNEADGVTFSQRNKEEAHDYRYFPEPDLPPLVIHQEWLDKIAASLPELPRQMRQRFVREYQLSEYDSQILVNDKSTAQYFEAALMTDPALAPKSAANWINGELASLMKENGDEISSIRISAANLAGLISQVSAGVINLNTAKVVFAEMYQTGKSAKELIVEKGLSQITNLEELQGVIRQALAENPQELSSYICGKETLMNWFFGKVMTKTKGMASPAVVRAELERQLQQAKIKSSD